MKLTKSERLILKNQYLIMMKLDPEKKKIYESAIEILCQGYELNYDDIGSEQYVITNDVMSVEECNEVIDILQMFERLNDSYQELNDKAGIDHEKIKFKGFDNNNEDKQLSYAQFLCRPDGKFSNFAKKFLGGTGVINAHGSVLSRYKKMLDKSKKITGFSLTKEEIISIIE